MRRKGGFTLIELMVVVAIIAVLATMVLTQLAGAQTRARNSQAKSDISEMGKAIEYWRINVMSDTVVDAASLENIPNPNGVSGSGSVPGTRITGSEATETWKKIFGNGTVYPVYVLKSPSASYTYGYVTNSEPDPSVPEVNGSLSANSDSYCVGTNTVAPVGATYSEQAFFVVNGSSITASSDHGKSSNGGINTVEYSSNGTCS